MAFPHPPGLLPTEVAFLCEMELVTIVPRQRLDRLDLLGVSDNHIEGYGYPGSESESACAPWADEPSMTLRDHLADHSLLYDRVRPDH